MISNGNSFVSNLPIRCKNRGAGSGGSVMLEFVIAFPVILVLIFACVQFAHIWIAKMVTHYAAFCAARTALVCHVSEYGGAPGRAAWEICKLVAVEPDDQSAVRTTVKSEPETGPTWNVTATVSSQFPLIAPIVGQIIAWSMNPWDENNPWGSDEGARRANTSRSGVFPTITLTETVVLPKPYVTVVQARF